MSHFAVLVIGEDVEGQLAPYQENNMGDCPEEYLEFEDYTDEVEEAWDNEKAKMIQCPNGEYVFHHDERFRQGQFPDRQTIIPPDHKDVEVPWSAVYESIDDFANSYYGYRKDESTGRYGYWSNPNAKWDWYQIGGRWTGSLKLKKGAAGKVGEPGVFGVEGAEGWVDQALKKDIDFEAMRNQSGKKAARQYDKVMEAIKDKLDGYVSWEKMRDEIHKDNIDQARDAYHAQEAVKAFPKRGLGWMASVDDFYPISREEYIQEAKDSACVFFAFLKDGEWVERGQMGWFGFAAKKKDTAEWNRQYNRMLDELDDDTLLTVVDCHI